MSAGVAAVPQIEKCEGVVVSVCPSVVEFFLCLMLLPRRGDHSKGLITRDNPPPPRVVPGVDCVRLGGLCATMCCFARIRILQQTLQGIP